MKKQALLFAILLMVSVLLQAQDPHPKAIQPNASVRVSEYFNPTSLKFKSAPLMVPAKRDMFNPSSSVWKWDTILCYDTSSALNLFQRVTRKYNSLGLPLSQLNERRQDGFIWENFMSESFTWDSAGNWLTYLAKQWQNNEWVNFMKQTFVYNSDGNMVDWKREGWQSTYWAKGWHYTWHYNSAGLLDSSMYQTGQDSLWVNFELWIPSYDTNGYVSSGLTYTWANNSWAVSRQTTYTFDSMGNCLTELNQNWQNASWVSNSLGIATYDSAGRGLSSIFQLWQNGVWANIFNYSYIYDSAGNMLSSLRRNWSGNGWENSNLNLYAYDEWSNVLSITYQYWNTSFWKNTYRQQYTYDSFGNSLTGKYLKWYYGSWHPEKGSLQVFADYQQDRYVNLPNLYRYSADVDSVMVFTKPASSPGQVSLFPNPAHSIVYFSSRPASTDLNGSLTIYDLRGQLVLSKQLHRETTGIDISGLKPGVYFVRYSDNRMTRVLKFVKD
ncbi:MAG: T9SS type A sorting domain-containing protein [Bacteroidales bacterium]|nr:T9SS type A sorting domain-containing protein [Bacteroidales bacterium]